MFQIGGFPVDGLGLSTGKFDPVQPQFVHFAIPIGTVAVEIGPEVPSVRRPKLSISARGRHLLSAVEVVLLISRGPVVNEYPMRPVPPQIAVRDGRIDAVVATVSCVPVDMAVVPWEVDVQDASVWPVGFDDAGVLPRQFRRVTVTPERYGELIA